MKNPKKNLDKKVWISRKVLEGLLYNCVGGYTVSFLLNPNNWEALESLSVRLDSYEKGLAKKVLRYFNRKYGKSS